MPWQHHPQTGRHCHPTTAEGRVDCDYGHLHIGPGWDDEAFPRHLFFSLLHDKGDGRIQPARLFDDHVKMQDQ